MVVKVRSCCKWRRTQASRPAGLTGQISSQACRPRRRRDITHRNTKKTTAEHKSAAAQHTKSRLFQRPSHSRKTFKPIPAVTGRGRALAFRPMATAGPVVAVGRVTVDQIAYVWERARILGGPRIADCRLPTLQIVEVLDVIQPDRLCIVSDEKRLSVAASQTLPDGRHRACDAVIGHETLEQLAGACKRDARCPDIDHQRNLKICLLSRFLN